MLYYKPWLNAAEVERVGDNDCWSASAAGRVGMTRLNMSFVSRPADRSGYVVFYAFVIAVMC